MAKVFYGFNLESELKIKLQKKALDENESVAGVLNRLIEEYIGKEKPAPVVPCVDTEEEKKEFIQRMKVRLGKEHQTDEEFEKEQDEIQKEWEKKHRHSVYAPGETTPSTDEFTKDPESPTIENMGGAQI